MKYVLVTIVLLAVASAGLASDLVAEKPAPGTVEAVLQQSADGSKVRVNAVQVYKIWTFSKPHYFAVKDRLKQKDY